MPLPPPRPCPSAGSRGCSRAALVASSPAPPTGCDTTSDSFVVTRYGLWLATSGTAGCFAGNAAGSGAGAPTAITLTAVGADTTLTALYIQDLVPGASAGAFTLRFSQAGASPVDATFSSGQARPGMLQLPAGGVALRVGQPVRLQFLNSDTATPVGLLINRFVAAAA